MTIAMLLAVLADFALIGEWIAAQWNRLAESRPALQRVGPWLLLVGHWPRHRVQCLALRRERQR